MSGPVPLNPDKARAWGETWREKYAPKHQSFKRPFDNAGHTEINAHSPGVRVVLELERQINGGKQLSTLPKPASAGAALLEAPATPVKETP